MKMVDNRFIEFSYYMFSYYMFSWQSIELVKACLQISPRE